MNSAGVIEIFFGLPWSQQVRLAYASFLREHGFGFYLYGPKADVYLRKQWQQKWPKSYVQELQTLSEEYRRQGLKFGVVLSPFGLHEEIQKNSAKLLREKTQQLAEIGIDLLGVFFDDMPNADGLAARQVEVLSIIQTCTSVPLVFCPTFYSFDPILDRVFGQRSPDYLDEIGASVPHSIEILWTGPKVMSDEITGEHLSEVAKILRRKPFICDNLFANDGPKNCKFIKLKNPVGLSPGAAKSASHWAFNPMNQPELSKLVLIAAIQALRGDTQSENNLDAAVNHCSKGFGAWLQVHRHQLLDVGLDGISDADKGIMVRNLVDFKDPAAAELVSWLAGKYTVGNECLTD